MQLNPVRVHARVDSGNITGMVRGEGQAASLLTAGPTAALVNAQDGACSTKLVIAAAVGCRGDAKDGECSRTHDARLAGDVQMYPAHPHTSRLSPHTPVYNPFQQPPG